MCHVHFALLPFLSPEAMLLWSAPRVATSGKLQFSTHVQSNTVKPPVSDHPKCHG